MKQISTLLCLLGGLSTTALAQSTALFDDERVSSIFIELPADSLQEMLQHLEHEYYYHGRFVFDDGQQRDTLEHIGLRLRGNTSLTSQKKSFKISFNEYEAGREYQGVRKLNLLGSHNDPTIIREKLFYHVWAQAGMPLRRSSFVKLFINNLYRGLYTNMEELDKKWLANVYGDNDGNFYKCTYPADLVYLGEDAALYKAILNNPTTRAYDLTTNETADDYTRLIALMNLLNQPVDDNYANNISAILNVEAVLKALALDVATGNWDDYFYNKNNYYLYDNPTTGRFEFVTYDTDNTFGVDWLGKDWAQRNSLQWLPSQQSRPLASKLLAVPVFFNQYVQYLDSIATYFVHPDSIFPLIDHYHEMVTPAAEADVYRTLDYGYSIADFHDGFTQTIDGHTPYGIKPFLQIRYDSTIRQIANWLSDSIEPDGSGLQMTIYPNPAMDRLLIQTTSEMPGEFMDGVLYDLLGRTLLNWRWEVSMAPFILSLQDVPTGMFRMHLRSKHGEGNYLIQKIGIR